MALNLFPELKELLGHIVVMGGGIERGDVTKFAEFNFAADPESVQYVLNSGVSMTLVPWDAALGVMLTAEDNQKMGMEDTAAGKLFLEIQKTPMKFTEQVFGIAAVAQADPVTMAYVIDENIASRKIRGNICIELNYNTVRGASVACDGMNLDIVMAVDKSRFMNLLVRIKRLK
jgi:inosine-uridine nucleoside N-ribohydrolase